MSDAPININPMMTAMLEAISKPYKDFVERLHSEGRISTEEVEALQDRIFENAGRLRETVRETLRAEGLEPNDD